MRMARLVIILTQLAMIVTASAFISLSLVTSPVKAEAGTRPECVVLLHGLARTASSMSKMAKRLEAEGYAVINDGYPSRKKTIEELAPEAVKGGVAGCRRRGAKAIHFVTHSLGGILVRYYLERRDIPELGRVVMLGPPNQGSEAVDALKDTPGFAALNGPAGYQLGTDEQSVPRQLGPAGFEVGVIAGTRSINLILSTYLPDPVDGKVSVQGTRLEGMADHLTVPHRHPFLMKRDEVIRQTLHFLRTGRFDRDA